ncbi:amino acid ABC transporter substrate-binding protein [Enterococcus villorum]|uniref:Amino acid ABC transporter substrate-binding protein n=1 Tax=Enterococcus villorum TaxID=112904 RepID=A0A1V8YV83_9ENTE|nr:amino acid ABC transporter substrate-binding protein [Enterococcus villorum]OQO70728.1 amino acid ABC transporter substrate-binding protein [Enterococcus villorum]OQO76560.1 amino acid ABC transporter substrate-binding protein [Enterococcus villorum]
MKKISLLLAIFAGIIFLSGCRNEKADKDNWATIQEEKKIIIGLDDTFVPMGFRDKEGKLTGFDIDLATAVFKEYGINVVFQPIDWSMKEFELNNGTIDLIWNGYSKTAERAKKVQFTKPYMQNEQELITPKKSGITSFAQMKGKLLGAQNGSSGYDAFTKQPNVLKNIVKNQDAVLYDSFNEALIDLKSGRIDGLLMDKVYAGYYLKQRNEIDDFNMITGDYESEDFVVGARKSDDELVKKINEGIAQLEKTGEFQKISEKWFGEDVTPVHETKKSE